MLNPEIAKKKHNIQSTQISEYSNAKHNNNVFVNPKNTSCWLEIVLFIIIRISILGYLV